MDFLHFTAGADDEGRRLDKILRRFLNGESLSSIYKLLRTGLIKVDGKKCKGEFRVREGNDISIAEFLLKEKTATLPSGASSPLKSELIIFRNDSILILNKPYDIPVHQSAASQGTSLAEIVQADYEATHEKNSLSFKTGPLHRLDRKTTGLIAFSQNLEGARWFSEAIKTHAIQKVYLALLEGNLTEKQVWEERIEKIENENRERRLDSKTCKTGFERVSEQLCCKGKMKNLNFQKEKFHIVSVNSDGENGKIAHTEIEPVSHGFFLGKDVTLARVLIKTGRTHQIRAQAAFHGFPLLGDTAYGGTKIDSKRFGQDFFLHARELHFPQENPLGLPKTLTAPLPPPFRKILENSDIPPYNYAVELCLKSPDNATT